MDYMQLAATAPKEEFYIDLHALWACVEDTAFENRAYVDRNLMLEQCSDGMVLLLFDDIAAYDMDKVEVVSNNDIDSVIKVQSLSTFRSFELDWHFAAKALVSE